MSEPKRFRRREWLMSRRDDKLSDSEEEQKSKVNNITIHKRRDHGRQQTRDSRESTESIIMIFI